MTLKPVKTTAENRFDCETEINVNVHMHTSPVCVGVWVCVIVPAVLPQA